MQGIGPRCVQLLNEVGIHKPQELREIGAMEAYLRIIEETSFKAHIALLYALIGAVENRSWLDIAKTEKAMLRAELEGLKEIRGE